MVTMTVPPGVVTQAVQPPIPLLPCLGKGSKSPLEYGPQPGPGFYSGGMPKGKGSPPYGFPDTNATYFQNGGAKNPRAQGSPERGMHPGGRGHAPSPTDRRDKDMSYLKSQSWNLPGTGVLGAAERFAHRIAGLEPATPEEQALGGYHSPFDPTTQPGAGQVPSGGAQGGNLFLSHAAPQSSSIDPAGLSTVPGGLDTVPTKDVDNQLQGGEQSQTAIPGPRDVVGGVSQQQQVQIPDEFW